MIAYKATYNFKCLNQVYKVGKTYTSDKMKLCNYGIHFCPKMEDVLDYYTPSYEEELIILEIEVLGNVEFDYSKIKGVTDKMKVLRIIPFSEYPDEMKKQFPVLDFDSRGNLTHVKLTNGKEIHFKYDENDNMIYKINPDGYTTENKFENGKRVQTILDKKTTIDYVYDELGRLVKKTTSTTSRNNRTSVIYNEYDDNGNMTMKSYDGEVFRYRYDKKGNMISSTDPEGLVTVYHYDDRGNNTLKAMSDGREEKYVYDDRNNFITKITCHGVVYNYEVPAIITESDD